MALSFAVVFSTLVQAAPVGKTAVFTGLNKITARISRLEVNIGSSTQFGTLEIRPDFCNKRPPEETPETTAFVEIFNLGKTLADELQDPTGTDAAQANPPAEPEKVFSGWMFASSPGLNAVEHPVYDVWLIDCIMVDAEASSGSE